MEGRYLNHGWSGLEDFTEAVRWLGLALTSVESVDLCQSVIQTVWRREGV